jgi:myo-inositol-1(or 4)-monophosphatase
MSGDRSGCIDIAKSAVFAAGKILMENLGRLSRSDIDAKGMNDFVTRADTESEKCIVDILGKKTPDFRILTEETPPEGSYARYRWIIDPLDGTTNYIHSFPCFAVSIALEEKDMIVMGVVLDPLREELFVAEKGKGAFLNDRRISVSQRRELSESFLATGFPFREHARIDPYLRVFREMFLRTSGVRRAGSAVLDLAYTACGRFDGFWEMGLSPWDVAAASLLITEAGGEVSDWDGGDDYLFGKTIVGSNGLIHPEMLTIIREHFREGS